MNHVEGQDGPDDFDRPQTVASFAAVVSTIGWDAGAEVEREIRFVRRVVTVVVRSKRGGQTGFTPELLEGVRS